MSAKVLARQQAKKEGYGGRPQPSELRPLPPAMNEDERHEMMRNAGNTSAGAPGQPVYTEDQVSTLMDQMEQHFRNQYVTVVDDLVYENDELKERIAVIEDQRKRSGTEVQHLIAGKEEARNLANTEGQEVLYELVDYLMSKYEDEAIQAKSEASKLAGIASALKKEVAVLEQEKKDLEENTLREFAMDMENEAMRKMEHEYKKIRMALASKEKELNEARIEHKRERLTLEKIIEAMTKEHREKYEAIRDENWTLERNLDKARAEYDKELRVVIASRDKLERDFQHQLVDAGEQLAHVKGKLESFQLRFDQLKVEKKILHEELDRAHQVNASAITEDKVNELKRQIDIWKEKFEREHELREREREEAFFRERHLKDIALEERVTKNEQVAQTTKVIEELEVKMVEQQSHLAESQQSEQHARLQKEKEIMLFHFEDIRSFHVERALDRSEIFRWQAHVRKLEKQFEKSMQEAQRRLQEAGVGKSDTSPRRRRRKGATGDDDESRSTSPQKESTRSRQAREQAERERDEQKQVVKQLTQIVQNLEREKSEADAKVRAQEAEVEALRRHTGDLAKHSQVTSAQLSVAQQQRTEALRKLDSFHAELLDSSAGSIGKRHTPAQSGAKPGRSDTVQSRAHPDKDQRMQPIISELQNRSSPKTQPQANTSQSSVEHHLAPGTSPPGPPVPPRSVEHQSLSQRLTRRLTETAPPGHNPAALAQVPRQLPE